MTPACESPARRQLQTGARVLDLRLAINPWIVVQQRIAQAANLQSSSSSRQHATNIQQSTSGSAQLLLSRLASFLAPTYRLLTKLVGNQQRVLTQQASFQWADASILEGKVNMEEVGGPLTAAERKHCIVTSHSLPAAPLVQVLADVRRFLSQNPGEVSHHVSAQLPLEEL